MKPMRYISLIIALLSVLGLAAQQQQSQYALYNYRNDGDFNAWLNIDVDSITYSNIGLDSVEYDNIVTQEVWTPDSCYRIPIEAIDSIGFRAPAPEFKDGIFHITEEHIPYTVVVDSLSVTFDSSIPASMLPAVGQVVISDVYEEPYEDGFAGRVLNIVSEDGTTRIECEEVGLEDVYDQLICVGKTIAYEDDEDMYSSRRKSPRKIKINEDGTIEVPLGKFSLKLSDGKTASINLSAKPSVDIDYNIVYNVKGIDNKFMIAAKPKMEYGIDYTVKFKKDIIPPIEEFLGFIPVETGIPGLRCKIRFGGFLELEGDVSVEGKLTYEMKATGGYDSSIEENNGFFFNHESGWKDPEVAINMEGKLFLGPMMQVFAYILYDKGGLPYAKFNVKPGVEVSGKIVASTDGLTEYGFSAYDLLKDTKVSFAGKLKAEASAGMFGKEFKLPSYTLSPDWLKQEYYLFPEFTKPELKGLNETSFSSTALFSEVTRDILFQTVLPVYVGMAVYDELDNSLAQDVSTRYINQTSKTYVGHNMKNYSAGKYIVRPVVKNVFGTFVASPVTEFTVPEPMTLNLDTPLNSVTLSKGQNAFYAINGGWGDYSAHSSMRAICDAEIVMNNDKPYVKISASNRMTGPATVTVKDLRAGTTETILVTVSSDAVPELTVSEQAVTLQESESKTILVTSGSGSYTAESSDESVATAIVEENNIAITAVGKGSASILVTDTETEKTVDIVVTVTGEAVLVTGITLSEATLNMKPNDTMTLTATVMPEDAENKTLAWESSNEAVATVSTDGLVTAVAEGSCVITCSATDGSGVFAECQVTVTSGTTPDPGNHAWVDLGLPSGTLWATCNVGASSPEEYGDYFAWGETAPKDYYDWSTYKWCNGSKDTMTKYCIKSSYGYNGFTDGKTELDPEDDAATKNWGSPWHMPTFVQMRELLDNCTREWTTQGGVNGILVTGPNGNTIFLPAEAYRKNDYLYYGAGSYGCYWSSSLGPDYDHYAYGMDFDSRRWYWDSYYNRHYGLSVRAVRVQN